MTTIQAMNPEMVEMFENHWKTVAPVELNVRNAKRPTAQVTSTAAYGIPRLEVSFRKRGACPDRAMENITREPE